MFRGSRRFTLLCLALLLSGAGRASATLADVLPELGDLQRWSVFTRSFNTAPDELGGNTTIQGDVGVAGLGDINLRGSATIQGNLYYRSNGTLTTGPGTTITGAQIHDQDGQLDNDSDAAIATSHHALSLRQNFFAPPNLELNGNQKFTATGAPGGTVVLKLGNFVMGGNSKFTLEGTATTTFIVNVSKQFSLSGNASIVLSGGVQWSNVLFNIYGRGSDVSLSGNSSLGGMLMANRRNVVLTGHASVTGEIIANRVLLSNASFNGGTSVTHPPIVSP